ncbi:LacI family DNA-binding transcriptional regulator [Aliiruegeria lutimaris]|uniref:DNA-binding transcriptional regulator, LacI/PurR family n=1 Tax=Aliiruegeria lutimaris TaxID=571298 RepID=A0A1G8KVW7_9RHOB|nr:LacI family DNA-binding transcriptional regulator [Aliiruegeria lutimaris]SDI47513.1 DNA-binding transcriptional regulator, LacI/PurR family [Aliiruegeria lutimaris]
MQKRITLKTVAEAAGVSVSAVSMALRDHPRISETKREEIKALARKLGYIYNRQAASLRRGTNDNISICVNDLHNPVFLEFLTAIERELRQSDKLVLLCNAHEECEIQDSFIRRMLEQGSSGLLLSPVEGTCPDTLRTIVQNNFPTVFFTRRLEDEGFDHVVSDDALGVGLAVDELVRLGHRRIAWIGGGQQTSTAAGRCEGFAAALQKHDLPLTEAMVEKVRETNLEAGRAAMDRILRHAPEVTAVACFSDLLALGAASTCREAGRSVGQDISIIGHDDLEQSVYFDPGLSSVRVAKEQIGRDAARLLLNRIACPEAPPVHETVAPSLILRGTTGPCPLR